MNKEIKKKWIAALRSGDYKQTSFRLHGNDGFCCLGVLCDIAEKEGICTSLKDHFGHVSYDETERILPNSVIQWSGASSHDPEVRDAAGDLSTLIEMNDRVDLGFKGIADVIEAQL